MRRHPPAQLAALDAQIDRCPSCGGWRWRKHCKTCEDESDGNK